MITEGAVVKRRVAVYIAAAAAVSIAGVIHLMLGPGFFRFNPGQALLFTVGGLAQISWIIPTVRQWGPVWYAIGIAGNSALFLIWLITRMPQNPINGHGFPMVNSMQIIEESAQLAYIGLSSTILVLERRAGKLQGSDKKRIPRSRRGLLILAGIVSALILTSLVLLPALMPRGGSPRSPPPSSQASSGQQNSQGSLPSPPAQASPQQ